MAAEGGNDPDETEESDVRTDPETDDEQLGIFSDASYPRSIVRLDR